MKAILERGRSWLSAAALTLSSAGGLGLEACSRPSAGEAPHAAAARVAAGAPELELLQALPIDAGGPFEPSGLLLYDGRLLTVSDKHDGAVYELSLAADAAGLRPFVTFEPPDDAPGPLDFEGLTADADGALLLISESRHRVLRLELDALRGRARASWLTPSLEAEGKAGGCFQVDGAAFEGITRLPDGDLLLAAERQPRGLVQLRARTEATSAQVWAMPESLHPVPPGRSPDFADLTLAAGRVYALARNSHLVTRLTRTAAGWQEGLAFSYARAENDARHVYESPVYGLAEGLAVSATEVFLVLDNNGQARAADASDRRPLLLVFARPDAL